MDIRTVGELRILVPDLDPRDLDPVTTPPDDDLTEAKVENQAWPGLQLAGIRISGSHLITVDLTDAALRNVTLHGCRFERVDLSGARLTGLTVERCEFIGCRMTGMQLAESTLKNVVFDDCRFDYANLNELRAAGPVAWIGCALTNAALSRCRLTTAAMTECRTTGLELNDCDLRSADLRGNDLSGIAGLPSLRGATIDAEQLTGLAALAVKDLDLTVLDR